MDFCTKVRRAGFSIWVDLDLSVAHVAQFALRAVRDANTGEWRTMLMRAPLEQIVIPAARPAPGLIDVDRRIVVPKERLA